MPCFQHGREHPHSGPEIEPQLLGIPNQLYKSYKREKHVIAKASARKRIKRKRKKKQRERP